MRALHHYYRLAQRNKRIGRTSKSNDAKPTATLPKCRTVNEQNRAAGERQDCNEWQQNPEHPLSESRVSCRGYLVVARCRHTGHYRGENRVEGLVHFSQTVRGTDYR